MKVVTKRVYEAAAATDGTRVLVDRIWPRGLTKERAAVEEWLRDLAPSNDLRRWHHAHPELWETFRRKYIKELSLPEAADSLRHLYELASTQPTVTLLFASKNETQNNATVLQELLGGRRKPPVGTGPAAAASNRRRKATRR